MCPAEQRILLVEDDPTMQAIVSAVLDGAGYEGCFTADDADSALSSLDGYRPSLVLMDISLSGEMDGIEAAEKIREIQDIPVVFLSGASHRRVMERVEKSGAYGFVAKPFEPEQLLAAVETALSRHSLDREIRKSRELLYLVLENIDEGILSINLDGKLLFSNEVAAGILGEPSPGSGLEELLKLHFPDDQQNIDAYLNEILRGKGTSFGTDLALRDRHKGYLNIRCQPMLEGGRLRGFVLVLRDLTEENRLIRELQSFRKAVDSMQIGVTITDLERNILYVNEAEAAMHGFEVNELLGRNARLLGTKDPMAGETAWIERPTRWSRETLNQRKDGSVFPVQLYSDVVSDAREEAVGLISCCQDLSARKAAEAEVRKLSQVVEQSPALVLMTDTDGNIEYVNPRFEKVTGYSLDEAIGANPRILKTEDNPPELYEGLWATITRGETWNGEFHNRKKNGSTYWAFASISGIRDAEGVIDHYVGIQMDITQLKKLEKELAQKNADLERLNHLKGDMMAIVSHDLKSPLNGMISLASMIRDLGDRLAPEKRERYIEHIIAEGQKLRNFISGILDAERLDAGGLSLKLVSASLEELLKSCIDNARLEARPKEISVDFEAAGHDVDLYMDPARMAQVFQNLLSNAIKFSPNGSRIFLDVESGMTEKIVRICDEGPGIPPESAEKIFNRYYQLESGSTTAQRAFGSGLGLYVSRQIVEMHGGRVFAENREGAGCCFVVSIPHAEQGQSEGEIL